MVSGRVETEDGLRANSIIECSCQHKQNEKDKVCTANNKKCAVGVDFVGFLNGEDGQKDCEDFAKEEEKHTYLNAGHAKQHTNQGQRQAYKAADGCCRKC